MKVENKKFTKIICFVCAAITVICLVAYTQLVKADAEEARNATLAKYGGEQVEVCVAKRDIAPGEKIDSTCYETKFWISDLLPEGAIRNSNEIIGKQATSSIVRGEVISQKRFQESSVSLEVPAGHSAVSVPAKDISAVGGAINVGMYIDVYATGNTSTTLIANNVLVLATSTSFSENSSTSSVKWITLAVEPTAVQEIVAASQTTTLYFVLPSDNSFDDEQSISSDKVAQSDKRLSGASTNSLEE